MKSVSKFATDIKPIEEIDQKQELINYYSFVLKKRANIDLNIKQNKMLNQVVAKLTVEILFFKLSMKKIK